MLHDAHAVANALIVFANDALAALEARMGANEPETLPRFELPTLDGFVGRLGLTCEEFAQLETHVAISSAVTYFVTLRQHMVIQGGLAGVWPYEESERLAVEFLGWKP